MKRSTWRWCGLIMVAVLPACQKPGMQTSRQEVQQQWSSLRAQVKYRLALENFQAGQVDAALESLRESLQLDPQSADARILLAKILIERGEIAAATAALTQAGEIAPEHAELAYLQGMIAQRYGRLEEALAMYRQAEQRDPRNALYVAAVAETLVALGRPGEALDLARSRWTDFEHNATLRTLVGAIHVMLGEHAAAADAYREAARIAPEDPVILMALGDALTRCEKYSEGLAVLDEATRKADVVPALTWIALGQCQLALNRDADAKHSFQKAVEESPRLAAGWTWLTRASISGGDWLTARRSAERAVELLPDDPAAALLLAYVCWCQHDTATAARIVEQVQRELPNDPLVGLLNTALRVEQPQTSLGTRGERFAAEESPPHSRDEAGDGTGAVELQVGMLPAQE